MTHLKRPISLSSTLLIAIMLMSGCTPGIGLKTENHQKFNNYSFKLLDQRPAQEKEDETLSFSITNCAYGIYRIGDDDTTPERISYLKNTLQQHRAAALKGHTIVIKKFTIHKNLQSHLRKANPYQQGLIPGIINSFQCFAKANEPGGFSIKENPSGSPAAIIEVTLQISGRTKHYRIVHAGSIDVGLWSVNDNLVPEAMEKTMAAILKSFRA